MAIEILNSLLFLTATLTFLKLLTRSRTTRNPPGPKGLPIIGNTLDFPKEKQWVTFTEWKKQYGDVVYMNVLGSPIVVLNSKQACTDLLEKRSMKYSGRPQSIILNEFMGFDYSFARMSYTPRWRRYRKLFHQHFNEHVSLTYRPIQESGVDYFLHLLLTKPDDFLEHIRLLFGRTIMDIVYGIEVEDNNDIFIQTVEGAVGAALEVTAPGRFLVEFFPALKYLPTWFPGGTFKRLAAEKKKIVLAAKDLPFAVVKERMDAGTAGPSVLSSMLNRAKRNSSKSAVANDGETSEDVAKGCASLAFLAGADTTLSTIKALFMVLANHQDIQRAAWKELDALLGPCPNRLPTHQDGAQLPFIVAITKELLRWHNVLPLGSPHLLTEDDEYNGYILRKGTVVFANIWAIMHDPEVYPDPLTFNPWRWLIDTPEGPKINAALPDSDSTPFGFGRRICPGRYFAKYALFTVVARVLTCFEIKPLDAQGQPADHVEEKFTEGLLLYPTPFNVSIKPRSDHLAQLIRDLNA